MVTQTTGSPSSKWEHLHCCVTFEYKDLYGEKTYRFCNLQKWKDFNKKKNSLLYIKCVLRLSGTCGPWADLWPFYGKYCKRFSLYKSVFTHVASLYANLWKQRKGLHKKRVQLPQDWFGTLTWPPVHCFGTPIWPPWRHVKHSIIHCLGRLWPDTRANCAIWHCLIPDQGLIQWSNFNFIGVNYQFSYCFQTLKQYLWILLLLKFYLSTWSSQYRH